MAGTARNGYTLMEVMVVAGLMSLMVLMASTAWTGLGRTSTDVIARCQVAQEARLAVETLQRDLGGSLLGSHLGEQSVGSMVGRLIADGSKLLLCFDGDPANGLADWAAPDTVISYEVQADRLVRTNQQTGRSVVVACHIEQLQLTDNGNGVSIDLTVKYRKTTRTYTVISKDL